MRESKKKEKDMKEEGLKVRKVWMKESRKREKEMMGWRSMRKGRRRKGTAAAQYAARRLVAAEKLWGLFRAPCRLLRPGHTF